MLKTDLLIIGGGIHGVGVAAEAATRGLSVVLCEKGDLAAATSSNSTKLIHGGLRYLEQGHFLLVRESLQERAILLKRAPQLVHPLKFILPISPKQRATWRIQLGLKLYDWLSGKQNIQHSKSIRIKKTNPLISQYKTAFNYYDAHTDDARLVILNALLARDYGAKILTHTECVKAEFKHNGWLISLKNNVGIQEIRAKVVVNAAGCAAPSVLQHIFKLENRIDTQFVKGSHIVIPKLYEEEHAYTLQNSDGRILFVIPYEKDFSLVGTTDVLIDNPFIKTEISTKETAYLIKAINDNFLNKVTAEDIVWSYSGIRCLVGTAEHNPSLMSREYKIDIDLSAGAPLISLFGGKLTTYRSLAETIVNHLQIYFEPFKPSCTAELKLPGGNIEASYADFVSQLHSRYPWLPEELKQRYANNYGTLCYKFLGNQQSLTELGFAFGAGLYQAEVDYLIKNEWAVSIDDILWRRSKLGLRADEINQVKLKHYMQKREIK